MNHFTQIDKRVNLVINRVKHINLIIKYVKRVNLVIKHVNVLNGFFHTYVRKITS